MYSRINKQSGMSFIEVLVAFFVLAFGILGVVAMQASASKASFDAMQRSVASSLAQDIMERMRANQSTPLFMAQYAGEFGAGLIPLPSKMCNTEGAGCTPNDVLAVDLYEWDQRLLGRNVTNSGNNLGGLTDVKGCISVTDNQVKVVISWQGRIDVSDGAQDTACGSASTKRRQVVVEAYVI
ncbi:type IV pilus modification protein PilV [Thalassotalea ponticola]|uniref:type IV pilus modification protein PilV n=1 Tax=Thalassotalea ponticola TaxID=1523392 RepID=UPI0025B4250F|nr:type IV pilus modification protein PilV [Thalassotalea ponticola]MDN3653971.1 type IV pilus modification protein PilV [Thalassotalea ponticola]